jgi:ribosomal-protein-alanine N-acetyltransferase
MNGEPNDRPEKLKVKLVPLTEEHMEAVMEIERDLFTQPWRVEDFKRLIGKPESINLAALLENKVVGYSCCWVVIETAELGNIAVARQYQGRFVARALLEATVKACRKQKVSSLFLEVRSSNRRAIELYNRYGFVQIGIRHGYYSHPVEDALIMKLEL